MYMYKVLESGKKRPTTEASDEPLCIGGKYHSWKLRIMFTVLELLDDQWGED